VPTAQLFPFDATIHWPSEIAGTTMQTYLEWQKGVVPVTMAGGPVPIGIQIVGPDHAELACLQLAHAYDAATGWLRRRPPPLFGETQRAHPRAEPVDREQAT
jgi:amidase